MSETQRDDSGQREIRTGLLVIAVFFLGFGVWAGLARLDAAVVAPGVVVVSGNRQVVQHRDGGVVSRLAVAEGQRVARGQVLMELAAPETLAREQALLAQVLDLQMQRARLDAEISGARRVARPPEWTALTEDDRRLAEGVYARHLRNARGAWSAYDARIAGHRQEIASLLRQEQLLEDELVGVRRLAEQQLVPLTRVRALERAQAELQGRRAALSAAIATAQQDRSEELRVVEARLTELVPQLAGAREQVERMRVRAPTSGVVVGLTMHTVGGVVRPGERILEIVPEDQALVVEAQIRPEEADDLVAGQRTEVRITAFTGRDMPILYGTVRHLSADRFVDEGKGSAYFIAQIDVPPEELERLSARGQSVQLRAGLPAQVIVPVRARTALQYLFEPLGQSLWRSFREH